MKSNPFSITHNISTGLFTVQTFEAIFSHLIEWSHVGLFWKTQ